MLINSLVLETAIDGLNVSGEMRFSGSAFSNLVIQFSKIGGVLDLTNTEARCAYLMKRNEIGEVVAINFGFGTLRKNGHGTEYDWLEKRDNDRYIKLILGRSDVGDIVRNSAECKGPSADVRERLAPGERSFVLFDNRVQSSLCLASFRRLSLDARTEPGAQQEHRAHLELLPKIALNYTTIGTFLLVNLGQTPARIGHRRTALAFQAAGLETRSFFMNFDDPGAPDSNFIDGLRFDRVYTVSDDVTCPYQKFAYKVRHRVIEFQRR